MRLTKTTLNRPDDDPFTVLVLDDLHDRAADPEAAERELRGSLDAVRDWKDELVRLVKSTDAKLTRLRAQEHRARAESGREGWLRIKADLQAERGRLMRFKSLLDARHAEAKALLGEMVGGRDESRLLLLERDLAAARGALAGLGLVAAAQAVVLEYEGGRRPSSDQIEALQAALGNIGGEQRQR